MEAELVVDVRVDVRPPEAQVAPPRGWLARWLGGRVAAV
jgi:hypothetical protein